MSEVDPNPVSVGGGSRTACGSEPLTSEPQSHGPAEAWYCVRTQPKHEHIAAGNLQRNLGLQVFNPRLRLERATRRGPVRVIEPLFPCYLFLRCVLEQRVQEIRYVTGVSSLVHFGHKIPVVPDAVVEELRQSFESEEPMLVEDRLYPGAEVTVAEGAFLGSRGLVVRLLPARQRVQILLDFLGRATVAEVERKSLILEESSMAGLVPSLARVGPARIAATA
jgi:transcriptional antiterminator RfaH